MFCMRIFPHRAGCAPGQNGYGRFTPGLCRNSPVSAAIARLNDRNNSLYGNHRMPEVTIVYWRDIPAQVIVGKGRRGSKVQLSERFEQAIDRCAMKIGAKDADAYLAEWRKADPYEAEGEQDALAASVAASLEATYDTARIRQLIDNEGWA
jgi:Virulence factor